MSDNEKKIPQYSGKFLLEDEGKKFAIQVGDSYILIQELGWASTVSMTRDGFKELLEKYNEVCKKLEELV